MKIMPLAVIVSKIWDGEQWNLDSQRMATRESFSLLRAKGMVEAMLREFAK